MQCMILDQEKNIIGAFGKILNMNLDKTIVTILNFLNLISSCEYILECPFG